MNPNVAENFSADEPDENGIIDIWENSGYNYGFTDANGNGIPDHAEGAMSKFLYTSKQAGARC